MEATRRRKRKLLAWYDRAARELPWRVPPGRRRRPDPYRVWLSEVMLQQTTVAAVLGYFETFVDALADGGRPRGGAGRRSDGSLGGARLLRPGAQPAGLRAGGGGAHRGGRFPDTEAGLRALPGIGAYTAAAIAAIAFDRPAVVMDGNVERVMARLFAVETPLPAAKPRLRGLAAG